jgi:hypothetical protein
MSKFDWARMYKDEEYIEREAYSCVENAIIMISKILQNLLKNSGLIFTHGKKKMLVNIHQ